MADIILHSGSFCDRNNNEISITFFKRTSTPEMTVDPTSFQYGGTGSTNTFTFTGVPAGGLSYEIPSGIDWVTVSNLTNSSVDITTSANNSPYSRTTTVKFYDQDDIDNYVTVTVNQDAGQSSLSVVPYSITYLPTGGTYGVTATWTAGTEPTATVTYVQGDPGWMTPTGSGSVTGNTKEWAWTASANNTGSSRTALITVTNGLQSEYVTVSQSSGVVSWSVTPSSIPDATAAGNTYSVTITGAPSGGMSYDVIYGSGDNWITITNFSQTGCSLTTSANSGSSQRTATVKFIDQDDIDHYITLTITQDGSSSAVLTVTPTSLSFVAEGEYKTLTATNISGVLTYSTSYSGSDTNWIMYSTSGSGSTKTVTVMANANYSSSSRSATAIFNDSNNNPVYVTITQDAGSGTGSISVSPSSVGLYYTAGQTAEIYVYGVSDFTYEVTYIDPNISGWLGCNKLQGLLQITTSMNTSSDSRYAVIKITNSLDPTDYVEVPVRQIGQNN